MDMDKNLLGAAAALLILSLLAENDQYGYQLIRRAAERSDDVFQFQEGTLYPLLHKLERQGYISSYEQEAESGRLRKYYAITSAGQKQLAEQKQQWRVFTGSVNKVLGGEACARA